MILGLAQVVVPAMWFAQDQENEGQVNPVHQNWLAQGCTECSAITAKMTLRFQMTGVYSTSNETAFNARN